MDVKTKKTKLGMILARLTCVFLTHDRERHRDFYGFLTNGQPIYVQRYDKCKRCGK